MKTGAQRVREHRQRKKLREQKMQELFSLYQQNTFLLDRYLEGKVSIQTVEELVLSNQPEIRDLEKQIHELEA
jgi:hypothetical protein